MKRWQVDSQQSIATGGVRSLIRKTSGPRDLRRARSRRRVAIVRSGRLRRRDVADRYRDGSDCTDGQMRSRSIMEDYFQNIMLWRPL